MYTDPVADMLTRIRNSAVLGHREVSMPYSKFKRSIAEILKQNRFVSEVAIEGEGIAKRLKLTLAEQDGEVKVKTLDRLSKPGRRLYAKAGKIPRPLSGRGLVIISTSSGVMSGYEAKKKGLGGELICRIY